jgi:hypothetical protein
MRNQMGLIPKNSPNPPQIPSKMRLSLDRRSGFRVDSDIICLLIIIYAEGGKKLQDIRQGSPRKTGINRQGQPVGFNLLLPESGRYIAVSLALSSSKLMVSD